MDKVIESSKELSFNVAEAISYKNFRDKINKVNEELKKNRYIEIWDKAIYSADKWSVKQ